MSKILNGKELSNEKIIYFSNKVESLKSKGIDPKLVVIIIGENPASATYVKNKINYSSKVNLKSETISLPENITEEELIALVDKLNNDLTVHGILVQFPLPKHINEFNIKCSISPYKDVDCFNPENVGLFYMNKPYTKPCTPAGVIEILKHNNIDVAGKKAVILGRSLISGKPMAELLNQLNASTTILHSKTKEADMLDYLKTADIIVSAVGKPKFITANMIGENQILIDIAINRDENNKLCGDFDTSCYEHSSYHTPVPGGVGPMTVAMLIDNTIKCAEYFASFNKI